MKTGTEIIAQGDVLFMRVDSIPDDATERKPAAEHVVAHSETGHHHVARAAGLRVFDSPHDPLESYLRAPGAIEVRHERGYDTHETVELLGKLEEVLDGNAVWKVRRQRQQTPEGMQRVVD